MPCEPETCELTRQPDLCQCSHDFSAKGYEAVARAGHDTGRDTEAGEQSRLKIKVIPGKRSSKSLSV